MRIAPCIALGILALGLAACSEEKPPVAPPPVSTEPPWPNISYAEIPPLPDYPLKTCVVTGKDLFAAGKSRYSISYKGYPVQFCSKECIREFAKDPDKYVYMVNPKAMIPK